MASPLRWWVQARAGQQEQQDNDTYKRMLGLKGIASRLPIPGCEALVAQHHDAGADAHITCLVYVTVLQLAKATQNASAMEQGTVQDVLVSDSRVGR